MGVIFRFVSISHAKGLREPAGVGQEALSLLAHIALLQMVHELRGTFSGAFAHRVEDVALRHAAEIVLDGRAPTGLDHVEVDGFRDAVGVGDALLDGVRRDAAAVAVALLVERVDAERGAMREERRLLVAGERGGPVPEIGAILRKPVVPSLVTLGEQGGRPRKGRSARSSARRRARRDRRRRDPANQLCARVTG